MALVVELEPELGVDGVLELSVELEIVLELDALKLELVDADRELDDDKVDAETVELELLDADSELGVDADSELDDDWVDNETVELELGLDSVLPLDSVLELDRFTFVLWLLELSVLELD